MCPELSPRGLQNSFAFQQNSVSELTVPYSEPVSAAQSQAALRYVLSKWLRKNKGLQFKLYRYITSSCKILTDEAMFAKPGDADWTLMQLPC